MNTVIPNTERDLWHWARECVSLYICPKREGLRAGPLVPYAGKDEQGRNLVGDIYFNFRRIENHPLVVDEFAKEVLKKLEAANRLGEFDTVCGIPEGGRTLGQALARLCKKRFVYPTKKPRPTEPGKKQEYDWDMSQFDLTPGERLAVVEDVCNNFQNTDTTLTQIGARVRVTLILCALNRSPTVEQHYVPKTGAFAGQELPVIAAVRQAYPEYRQDDPEVAADIARGNIEWEVKKNWEKLMWAMSAACATG